MLGLLGLLDLLGPQEFNCVVSAAGAVAAARSFASSEARVASPASRVATSSAYGLADAANAANEHALARRVLLVIAATLALAATTAGTAAGLREVGPRDALASASAATMGAMSANAGVKGEFALAGFEITMQGAVGGAVRYEFARKGASGGAGEVESY